VGTGGNYQTAISAEGINASVITTGRLNTGEVYIYADGQETFRWDAYGLSAYAFDMDSQGKVANTNFNKFVRMDRFGLYGITNKTNYRPASVDDVINDAMFSLTWRGLTIHTDPQQPDVININNKFIVDGEGNVTAKNGTFTGTVYATDGEFAGTIKAANLMIKNGGTGSYVNILDGNGKIDSNYLDLGNIKLDGNNGNITLTGAISFDTTAKSSIMSAADDGAKADALSAYNTAVAAARDAAEAESAASAASIAASNARNLACQIANGTYSGGTFISGNTVVSPYITGGTITGATFQTSGNIGWGQTRIVINDGMIKFLRQYSSNDFEDGRIVLNTHTGELGMCCVIGTLSLSAMQGVHISDLYVDGIRIDAYIQSFIPVSSS
jgi:hypothetical protein